MASQVCWLTRILESQYLKIFLVAGLGVQACNSSYLESEAGGSQGHGEVKTRLGSLVKPEG